MIKVSDYIIEFLLANGIDTIFTLSGGFIGPILNSISLYKINYYCLCTEQACAMAADAYYRISGKPSCLLITNGPGASNTFTGVIGAFQDSIPIFVISGNVPLNQSVGSQKLPLRQLGVQELNIMPIIETFTNYCVTVNKKEDVVELLNEALNKCIFKRGGPVWVELPLDIQNASIENTNIPIVVKASIMPRPNIDFAYLISKIKQSKRPLILIGNGIGLSKTEDVFNKILEKIRLPVVSSWLGKDIIINNNPLFYGNIGILGQRFSNFAVQKCDLLIILGCRLNITHIGYDVSGFSKDSYKIMVDIDSSELNKNTISIDYKINDNLHGFLNEFNNYVDENQINELPEYNTWKQKLYYWKNKYPNYDTEIDLEGDVNSYYFSKNLSLKLKPNTTVITDTGSSSFSIFQSLQINEKNIRLFSSCGQCSMGFGLPGSIGAYIADQKKETIVIAGDGGFQMNIQELQTLIHYNIPVKIFILNNNGYLAIKLMQQNLFNKNYVASNIESGVSSPDFNKVAESYGLKTFSINKNSEINIIEEVLNYKGPCLCNIKMIESQLIIPRVQSIGQKKSLEYMYPYIDEEELKTDLFFD